MGARRYLLSKSLQALATLLFVLTFNFFLFRVLPGDPVGLLARSQRLTEADIAEQRATSGSTSRCRSSTSRTCGRPQREPR